MAKKRQADYIAAPISKDATLTSDIEPSDEAVRAQRTLIKRSMDERVALPADSRAVLKALLATAPPQD